MSFRKKPYPIVSPVIGGTKYTQLGKKVRVRLFPGGIDTGTSLPSQHSFQIGDSAFNTDLKSKNFSGGKDVQLINIANNSLTGVTIDINGKTIAFGTDVAIGVDATATETNLQTYLNGLKVNKLTTLVAAIDTGQVKVTGSIKEPLTITPSDPAKVVVTNGTFIGATLPITFADNLLVEGTPNVLQLELPTTDDSNNTKADRIQIIALTPANATTRAVLIARIKAVFGKALSGSAPLDTDGVTELGYIFSENGRTYAQISTALQAIFGSTLNSAFTNTSTGFTLNVIQSAYLGVVGNGLQAAFATDATDPNLDIFITENLDVVINGTKGFNVNSIKNYDSNDETSTATVGQTDLDQDYLVGKTGANTKLSFVANDVHLSDIKRLIAGNQVAYTGTHTLLMSGGKTNLPVLGVVALIDTDVQGQYHVEIANIYPTDPTAFKGEKGSVDGVQIGGAIIPRGGATANPGKLTYLFRQAGQS